MNISPFFWERKNNKPGLNFKVEVRKSLIKNGGNGLFALEFIPKNSIFKTIDNYIYVDNYIQLAEKDYKKSINENYYIYFKNENDIEKIVTYFDQFKILSKDEIRKYISWFISIKNNILYLNSYSNHLNSSNNNNLCYKNIDSVNCVIANRDILKNEELLFNYNYYEECEFYENWLKKYNLKNVKNIIDN